MARRQNLSAVRQGTRSAFRNFETANTAAAAAGGAVGRQIRTDWTSKSQNNYRFGTREEVQAQHNRRYRDLRAAFGMSQG